MKKKLFTFIALLTAAFPVLTACCSTGEKIDELNGVPVCYNGIFTSNVHGVNKSDDGYLYGLKWQCVEFVKRYYCQKLNHKMPNVYGNARDFFNDGLQDGAMNRDRGLVQYKNGGRSRPRIDDIVVFNDSSFGHVAIVSKVDDDSIEVIQQNVWIITRRSYGLEYCDGCWLVNDNEPGNPAGWLRLNK